ncbi:hypothetical protein ACFWCF_25405 [Rhodococcus sp. NPDC060090]|uniref:hypothetical protein n=1 Tax=Rhodococcus sp. NPDC060090 TaxID=3347056 RepID=UPI00365181FE
MRSSHDDDRTPISERSRYLAPRKRHWIVKHVGRIAFGFIDPDKPAASGTACLPAPDDASIDAACSLRGAALLRSTVGQRRSENYTDSP